MNVNEIVQSHGWRNFMAKLYGIGASVVILGAMFKIQHWPGGSFFITLGLCTEVVIFFFSAFEPLHEELDWTLVYPELAGMADEDELQSYRSGSREALTGGVAGPASSGALARFDELLEKGEIDQALFDKLGVGLKNLSNTTASLSNISEAGLATKEFSESMRTASDKVQHFSNEYEKNTEEITKSVSVLSESYQKLSESVSGNLESMSENNSSYAEKLGKLNKNLEALNSVYELQLQNSNEQIKGAKELSQGMNQIMNDLKSSFEETQQYRDEISKLSKNLAELNNVYGNMLSAMSAVTKN
ncbi:gliding motility protein GldL [Bacteroidota bacterium]